MVNSGLGTFAAKEFFWLWSVLVFTLRMFLDIQDSEQSYQPSALIYVVEPAYISKYVIFIVFTCLYFWTATLWGNASESFFFQGNRPKYLSVYSVGFCFWKCVGHTNTSWQAMTQTHVLCFSYTLLASAQFLFNKLNYKYLVKVEDSWP